MPISPEGAAECTEVASSLLSPLPGLVFIKISETLGGCPRLPSFPRLRRFTRLPIIKLAIIWFFPGGRASAEEHRPGGLKPCRFSSRPKVGPSHGTGIKVVGISYGPLEVVTSMSRAYCGSDPTYDLLGCRCASANLTFPCFHGSISSDDQAKLLPRKSILIR